LGEYLHHAGRHAEALPYLVAAVNGAPDNRVYPLLLADALLDAGAVQEAVALFRQVQSELPPGNPLRARIDERIRAGLQSPASSRAGGP
jgi:cytochrome c-type biogenesis protein CcmH/NrfG